MVGASLLPGLAGKGDGGGEGEKKGGEEVISLNTTTEYS